MTLQEEVKQLLKVICLFICLFADKIFLEGNIAYSEALGKVSNCEYEKTI